MIHHSPTKLWPGLWPGLWLGLAGCHREPPPELPSQQACPPDTLEPGEVQIFATGFDADTVGAVGTEGLTAGPGGRLFVGGSGVLGGGYVAELYPDGTWSSIVDLPGSVGLAWWRDRLMVATSDTGDGSAGVVAVDPDAGTSALLVAGLQGANFLAVTPWDTLLVSSPDEDVLWQISDEAAGQPPTVQTWAEGVPSPNGVVFDLDGETVYVANTYRRPSVVSSIPVFDGAAGAIGVLATLPDGSTQDGVALDATGALYVANNVPGTIARISPDGSWDTLASGVAWGASLAFGEGGGFDPCSLYVSSLFSADVFRVGTGTPGAPLRR
ncbi:MAG TPA: hypothetical protein ENK18_18220 [Deltaproteobacteria bacterium]|nr:hypothetical protein [Deltaproteobacteria bacterium]